MGLYGFIETFALVPYFWPYLLPIVLFIFASSIAVISFYTGFLYKL